MLHKVREFANFRPPFIRWALLPRLVPRTCPFSYHMCTYVSTYRYARTRATWLDTCVCNPRHFRTESENFLPTIEHRSKRILFFVRIGEEFLSIQRVFTRALNATNVMITNYRKLQMRLGTLNYLPLLCHYVPSWERSNIFRRPLEFLIPAHQTIVLF